MGNRRKARAEMFQNIDWYCDRCNAYLNIQPFFSDSHYVWKCTKCGYKNSISKDNIIFKPDPGFVGVFLGWVRSLIVYSFLTVVLYWVFNKNFVPGTPLSEYWIVLVAGYVIVEAFSMFYEKKVKKYCADTPLAVYIITMPFVNLGGDLLRPFQEVVKFFVNVFQYSKYKVALFLIECLLYLLIYLPLVVVLIYSVIACAFDLQPIA